MMFKLEAKRSELREGFSFRSLQDPRFSRLDSETSLAVSQMHSSPCFTTIVTLIVELKINSFLFLLLIFSFKLNASTQAFEMK